MGLFKGLGCDAAENDILVLILIVLLFANCGDGLFNEEILAVIIILWLIIFNTCGKECC